MRRAPHPRPGHECPGYKSSAGRAGFKKKRLKPHSWGAARVARRFIAGRGSGESTGPGHESGFALLTALFVVALLGIALAILAAALQIRMRLVRQEAETLQLRALADAALAETLASLAYDKDFPGASPHAFAGGSIASAVTPVSPPSRYTVVVRAVRGRRARAVRADVARAPGRAWVVSWQPVVGGRASG